MTAMVKLVLKNKTAELDAMCQHDVYSAWFDVDFGGCPFGVFSAAMPVEALHSLEGGLIKDSLEMLYVHDLKEAKCIRLDEMVKQFCDWDRQAFLSSGADKRMPRLLFKDGISKLTKCANIYCVGMMLAIVVLTLSDEGKTFLADAFESRRYPNPTKRVRDLQKVFVMLLAYWSWLRQDTFWKQKDLRAKQTAELSIRTMINELKRLWNREKGQGWCIAKVHEQIHVPSDIKRNGSPRTTYSGPVEHNHLVVKRHSKRTQRNRVTLDKQIGKREADAMIVDTCHRLMTMRIADKQSAAATSGISSKSARVLVEIIDHNTVRQKWVTGATKQVAGLSLSSSALQFLQSCEDTSVCQWQGNSKLVTVHTEYKRNDVVFRAHPLHNKNPWHDWVMIRWDKPDEDKQNDVCYHDLAQFPKADENVWSGDDPALQRLHHYSPGKLLGFVCGDKSDDVYAMVECTNYCNELELAIVTKWNRSFTKQTNGMFAPEVNLVPVDSIVRQCLIVSFNNDSSDLFEIWDRDRWASAFSYV
jgi:hypothetical protein